MVLQGENNLLALFTKIDIEGVKVFARSVMVYELPRVMLTLFRRDTHLEQ